jgi:hypothetical protein
MATTSPETVETTTSKAGRWQQEPGPRELFALVAVGFVIFAAVILVFRPYAATIDNFGDSWSYVSIAHAIRTWDFGTLWIKHFWGLPYVMALLSMVTHLSDRTSLIVVSAVSAVISVELAYELWGGWIAGFFAVLNFDWWQRAMLGGSEPLAVAFLFGAFLAVRKERWALATVLAALSTITRPLDGFALLAIGGMLLWRREYRKLAVSIAIGLAIGIAYVIPVAQHFGSPLANVQSYHDTGWSKGWLFGIPFYAMIAGTIMEPAPWTNLLLSFFWIFLVLAGIVGMFGKSFRGYAKEHPVEVAFAVPFLWCLFAYNYPHWARATLERFCIPILPLVFVALYRWIPKDRRLLWALGIVCSALAGCSAIGIRNVAESIRHLLG